MKPQPQSVDTLAHTVIPYTGSAEFLMEHIRFRCPFGSPGDLLWVKETWATYRNRRISEQTHCKQLDHDGDPFVLYRADGTALEYVSTEQDGNCYPRTVSVNIDDTDAGRWHSPVSMPRWASRLTLEIVDIKAEHLHAVIHDDVEAEGLDIGAGWRWIGDYACHWDKVFPKYPWRTDPWTWVVSFHLVGS